MVNVSKQRLVDVERALTTSLVSWSVASMVVGTSIALAGHKFAHKKASEFGRQTAAWGAVDAGIAGVGYLSQRRRGALSEQAVEGQIRKLRITLLINAVADIGYIAGGVAIIRRHNRNKSSLGMGPGDGFAIVIQGAFLFVLDVSQAQRLLGFPQRSV